MTEDSKKIREPEQPDSSLEAACEESAESGSEKTKGKMTPKRVAAVIALVLLAALYIMTFVVAIVYPPGAGNLFGVCLMATIAVPLLAWIYIWLYGQTTGKKTIADLHLMQSAPEDEGKPETEEETNGS